MSNEKEIQCGEIHMLQYNIQTLQDQLNQQRYDYHQTIGDLKESSIEAIVYKDQIIDDLEKIITSYEQAHKDKTVTEMRNSLEIQINELQDLKNQWQREIQSNHNNIIYMRERHGQYIQNMNQYEQDLLDKNSLIVERDKHINFQEKKLIKKQDTIFYLERQLIDQKKHFEDLQNSQANQILQLNHQINDWRQIVKKLDFQNSENQQKINNLATENKQLKHEKQITQNQAKSKLQSLQKEIKQNQMKISQYQMKYEDLEHDSHNIQMENELIREEYFKIKQMFQYEKIQTETNEVDVFNDLQQTFFDQWPDKKKQALFFMKTNILPLNILFSVWEKRAQESPIKFSPKQQFSQQYIMLPQQIKDEEENNIDDFLQEIDQMKKQLQKKDILIKKLTSKYQKYRQLKNKILNDK